MMALNSATRHPCHPSKWASLWISLRESELLADHSNVDTYSFFLPSIILVEYARVSVAKIDR